MNQRTRWKAYKATQRAYPLYGQPCEVEGCHRVATERHHWNGDVSDIHPENVYLLCAVHHIAMRPLILNHGQIANIRASRLPGRVLGKLFGISARYVNYIRAGTRLKA